MTANNKLSAIKRRAGKKSAKNRNDPKPKLVVKMYTRKVEGKW